MESDISINPKLWGHEVWKYLFGVGVSYPTAPSSQRQVKMKTFLENLILACGNCEFNWDVEVKANPLTPDVLSSRKSLLIWFLNRYNDIAKRVGKSGMTEKDLVNRIKSDYGINLSDLLVPEIPLASLSKEYKASTSRPSRGYHRSQSNYHQPAKIEQKMESKRSVSKAEAIAPPTSSRSVAPTVTRAYQPETKSSHRESHSSHSSRSYYSRDSGYYRSSDSVRDSKPIQLRTQSGTPIVRQNTLKVILAAPKRAEVVYSKKSSDSDWNRSSYSSRSSAQSANVFKSPINPVRTLNKSSDAPAKASYTATMISTKKCACGGAGRKLGFR